METMQYFFGILKIEKGKQLIINPEPTAEKKILAQGPFNFIAPVISIVKRGAMKKDYSYFESIEQAEKINEAQETVLRTQLKVQEEIQKELIRMQKKMIADLSMKELEGMVERLSKKNLYKDLQNIPENIRKKVS